jgi:hypothetical protein
MDMVAIDPTKGVRKTVLITHEDEAAVDDYRRAQQRIPSESQALADLIRRGLQQWRQERERQKKS